MDNKFVRPLPLSDERDASGNRIPLDDTKRINHRDQFELTLLRWRYLMRAGNPPRELLERFRPLCRKLANQNMRRFSTLYSIMGMTIADIESVAMVQLVSYLGVFSIEFNEENCKAFEQEVLKRTGKMPSIGEMQEADLKKMAAFINQRLLDCARVCSQKSKSVENGSIIYEMYALVGEEKDCSDASLVMDPARYGFKRLPKHVATKVRKESGQKFSASERFVVGGKVYRLVYETFARVSLDRFNENSALLAAPDEEVTSLANRARYEKMLERYKKLSAVGKKKFLTRMIRILRARGGSEKELELAQTMLSKLR